jgi:hypothetical protein
LFIYDQEVTNWIRSYTTRVVTLKDIGEIFGTAHYRAVKMTTTINGFKNTGIFPFNPNILDDHDLMPAETTNIPTNEIPYDFLNSYKSPPTMPISCRPRSPDPILELLKQIPDTVEDI